MLETKGGKIALLIFMAVILAYTINNYMNGKTSVVILAFAVFIAITTGTRIVMDLLGGGKEK